jgi:beta-glucosidase/6-phospho-beta-glucosidase/beta-galactosidase/ABC-type amino acid transport substrate-binding protein
LIGSPPLFGVATADHQCEAYEARWEDLRDRWDRDRRLVERGRATDLWTRYPEDVALARSLGCTAFRFSLAWARVEPAPGTFDAAVLDHYREMTRVIAAAGMEPVVTLLHNTWPLHVQDAGDGVLDAAFPDRFGAYAEAAARALGPAVRWWVTINEPNQLVYGFLKPWWQGEYRMPPGLPPGAEVHEMVASVRVLMRRLFEANALARSAIRAARPDAMVGTNPLLLGLPGWLQRFLDWRASRLRSEGALDAGVRRRARPRRAAPGRVDLVAAALSATPARGREVDFSRPYRVATLRLLVPAGSAVTGGARLRGAAVAVVRGTTAESAATEVLPGATVRPVPDTPAALAELAAGHAAALLGDDAILEGVAARDPGRWAVVGEPLRPERYVAAVANGDAGLLQVVDDAIAGTTPASPRPGVERVRRRGRLVAGVRADVPGLGFRDPETGRWSGQEIDLVRDVAARVLGDGDRVTLVPLATGERIPALRSWTRVLDPLRRWVDLLLSALDSNWWHLGMAGRLPEWLCPAGCAHQQDYVGVDYYWGIPDLAPGRVRALFAAIAGDYAHAPVWPGAMRRILRSAARLFPGLPVLVVENGSVPVAGGVDRVTYLRQHVGEALRAASGGVPLAGYLCWSITSNREWGLPFGPASDFGLYHVDLDRDPALARVATPAAAAYAELVRTAVS